MMHPRLDFDSQALEAIAVRGTILAAVLLLGSAGFAWAQGTTSGTTNQPAGTTTATPATNGSGNQVSPAGESPYDAQADSLLKHLTARQFDARLPNAGLLDWFSGQIGKRGQIDWTTAECGDEGSESDSTQGTDTSGTSGGSATSGSGTSSGGASASNNDVTLCSEGQALFYGADGKPSLDRYVVLQIWVGTKSTGVNQDPSHYGSDAMSIFVFDGDTTRTLTRLGDLPAVLATMN